MTLDRRRSSENRRQDDRVVSIFAVRSHIGLDVQLCQCEDMAQSGMALRRPDGLPLPVGMPVTLSFELPRQRGELTVKGVVVSDRPAGQFRRTGVRFTVVSRATQQRIARHCAERKQAQSGDDPFTGGAGDSAQL